MEKFLAFLHGYVQLSVSGEQCERFLNLCRSRKILIRKLIRCGDDEIRFLISVSDFWKLKPIRSKTGVHIHILKKCGLPFFFYRNKKRKAFFVGILLCLLLLFAFSTRIWNIHVEGNQSYSSWEILGFLKGEGVVHGMAKSAVKCSDIAAMVREQYPKITWVSARIQGTRLILTIQEGKGLTQETKEPEAPCNLSADIDGTIVKIITRAGVPQVKPGDSCKAGDLLVLGRLEILNDSQEVVRYEYVQADADVYVQRDLSYYQEFPMEYTKTEKEGTVEKGFYLRVGDWQAGSRRIAKDGWQSTEEVFPLRLTENFRLPIWIGKILRERLRTSTLTYTPEEATALAKQRLYEYEENLIEKGVQIYQNNVKIETDYEKCVSSGSLTVIVQTGERTSVEYMEQPQERTTQDG